MLSMFGQGKEIDDKINQRQELIPYVTALCGQASLCLLREAMGYNYVLSLALASDTMYPVLLPTTSRLRRGIARKASGLECVLE